MTDNLDIRKAHLESLRKPRRMLQPIKDEIRRQREVALAEAAYWRAKYDDAVAELEGEAKSFGAGFLSCALLVVVIVLVSGGLP